MAVVIVLASILCGLGILQTSGCQAFAGSAPIFRRGAIEIDFFSSGVRVPYRLGRQRQRMQFSSKRRGVDDLDAAAEDDDDVDDLKEDWPRLSAELVSEDEDDGLNDGDVWLPDRVKALERKERARIYAEKVVGDDDVANVASTVSTKSQEGRTTTATTTSTADATERINRSSAYTDEEEEVIAAMGGKTRHPGRRREAGFIGDSTLAEIATDYSVPISYLADVLCLWGVPIPINIHETLGNLVTGEQAFAIVEAVNTLDVSALQDRYSNTNVQQLCYEWDIDLQEAFALIMREGWSLPFGVQTCLRVEQERELLRLMAGQSGKLEMSEYDDENDDD